MTTSDASATVPPIWQRTSQSAYSFHLKFEVTSSHMITDQLAPTCQFSYKLFQGLFLKSWRAVAYFIWNSFPTLS
jgi:hypothetical protein